MTAEMIQFHFAPKAEAFFLETKPICLFEYRSKARQLATKNYWLANFFQKKFFHSNQAKSSASTGLLSLTMNVPLRGIDEIEILQNRERRLNSVQATCLSP
jgi:hypothetical protein